MKNAYRPLVLAAAVTLVAAAAAQAQTVIVRSAPPGTTIEVVVNAETLGTATTDEAGNVAIPAGMFAAGGKRETDANLYVDVCPDKRRIIIVERGEPDPAQDVACIRTESLGLFLVRPVSTFVVNASTATPTVMLRQGPVSVVPEPSRESLPTGFVVFGGAGMGKFRDANQLACGNVEDCSGDEWDLTYTTGAEFWLSRFISAELGYVRRRELEIEGRGTGFDFASSLDSHLTTVAGKFGIPMGPVRAYAKGGTNYLRAATVHRQTMEDITVEIDGEEQVIEGGTVTSRLDFSGWGWLVGGGLEIWAKPSFAIYTEGGLAGMKGHPREDAEGSIDDRLTYFVAGLRIRIGG